MKSLILPVLPIPNVVFFPNTELPIFLVDQVYVRMIKECVREGMLVAISLAEPIQNSFFPTPKFRPKKVCSYGKPIILEELADGTIKVLIKGVGRVQLETVIQNLPYLVYEGIPYPDLPEQELLGSNTLTKLQKLLESWTRESIPDSLERESFMKSLTTLNHMVDYISMFLIQDREVRQVLLETTSIFERIQMLKSLFHEELPLFEDIQAATAIKSYESIEKIARGWH
ncbi:MAG: LON peptidase substrate-binding domain-containing protein [Halobacteriovoraceae bacterium]|jgi:uncharacterized protein|nr:LON peptidase substrate-binding domain-containing protein [Halobacteriovoraceae bacterium]MBT5095742.1 LON peptidase substrate-binding domain-containing protein [Halobacteriovoraceae bacterium]